MAERKPISKKTRFEIFKRDGFSCRYCGAHPPEAVATKPYSEHSAFKYFCGICWTKIKNPNGTR